MTQPTKFQIMRRNRRVLESAAQAAAADSQWDDHRHRLCLDREQREQTTQDWLAETRESARQYKPATVQDLTLPPPRRMLAGLPMRLWWAIARTRRTA